MSRTLAEQSISSIDDLAHAVAGIAHVEEPHLDCQSKLRRLRLLKDPYDNELAEAKAKLDVWEADLRNLDSWSLQWFVYWITCDVANEKERCEKGRKKAKELVAEAQSKVDMTSEKIKELEESDEKYSVDYRSLQRYREELSELLDSIFDQHEQGFPTEKEIRAQVAEARAYLEKAKSDVEKLKSVKELLKTADFALLEAIVELRQSNDNKSVGEGRIYFPEKAFNALKEARELYPELPSMEKPKDYINEADNTGAFYSPLQRYLWEVRKEIEKLIEWVDSQDSVLLDEERKHTLALGAKVDEWNLERRRLVKEVILNA